MKTIKLETALFTRKSDGKPFAKLIIRDITTGKRYQLKRGVFEAYTNLTDEQFQNLLNYIEEWAPQTTQISNVNELNTVE